VRLDAQAAGVLPLRGVSRIANLGLLVTGIGTCRDTLDPSTREGRACSDLKTIQSAIDLYHVNHAGRLPDSLEQLVDESVQTMCHDPVPIDPWDNEYFYKPSSDGASYELCSYGSDGSPGGDGEAKDIALVAFENMKRK
jgi:type II secretion system (T2SS) protein G